MIFAARVRLLEQQLARLPSLLVALSGGVDSGALLGAAVRALPGKVRAATTSSPAVPHEEIAQACALAARLGVPHEIVPTDELADPLYRANRGDRCYHCRRAMYGGLGALSDGPVGDGLLYDDAIEDRPGVRAAAERGILHPLREAGITKVMSRRLARAYGLPVHDKPAQPCLASRIPVGHEVTVERLERVHRAEGALRLMGYRELRVRCHDAHARIEIGATELARAQAEEAALLAAVLTGPFRSAELSVAPLRA